MGFPFICSYSIIMPKPIDGLLDLWSYLKFLIRLALFYLGLFDPTEPTNAVAVTAANYNGVPPRRLPQLQVLSSLAPRSTTPDSIKEQLPVMNFAEFTTRAGIIRRKNNDNDCDDDKEEEEEAATCAVCLCSVQGHHEVRKLGNCNHVFHMGCLDSWVDLGQVTCPLCRSLLVPQEGKDGKAGKDSWVVERISYLFSEDLVMSHWADYHH